MSERTCGTTRLVSSHPARQEQEAAQGESDDARLRPALAPVSFMGYNLLTKFLPGGCWRYIRASFERLIPSVYPTATTAPRTLFAWLALIGAGCLLLHPALIFCFLVVCNINYSYI